MNKSIPPRYVKIFVSMELEDITIYRGTALPKMNKQIDSTVNF